LFIRIENNKPMKIFIPTLSIVLFLLGACTDPGVRQANPAPKAQVTITKITHGYLPDYIEMTGKTIYLNKTTITAPINGYVTQVNIKQGDKVKKNSLLFEMQTPEAYVMGNKAGAIENYGIIKITAPVNGRVVNLNIVSSGVFSNKGNALCTLLASNDLMLQVNVPFEFSKFTNPGNRCMVVLPDGKKMDAVFTKTLAQVDEKSQTVKVLAKLNAGIFIPENVITKVLVDRSKKHNAQIIPKSCLQTDALMTKFWIMKLINDSTAVQVPVTVGNQTHDQAEILSPGFDSTDLFVNQGAYGLSDTVLVQVVQQ